MRVLELFSGTGSVKKVCDKLQWESVSVDMILPADHQVDIMEFDYKQYPKDYFDIVWASPPCTNYSALKKCWYGRKLKDGTIYSKEQNDIDQNEADKLVLKSFEIIEYFNPKLWFLENPQTGNLKNREIMKDKPFYDVDYCMYSDWGYKKRTRIWTNKKEFNNKLCDGSGSCGNMIEIEDGKRHLHKTNCGNTEKIKAVRQHIKSLDNGYEMIDGKNQPKDLKFLGKGTNRIDRYRVPEQLIMDLLQ
mgnify:CR=1 FL=1|tara:strand:- start:599 stop:1339 length:741 start_codon:yes stop_codon:yes gene_type:complete